MTTYPRKWQWPDGQRIAMSVGLAFEGFAYQSQLRTKELGHGKVNKFSLSYADYGWKQGGWRILDLLGSYGLKGNMSTSGLAAEQHPEVVAAFAKAGHEINAHGWVNDIVADDSNPEAEREEIRRCTKVLTQAAGAPPVGWTGPGSTCSQNTLEILKAEGYLWNGDDASDDIPFVVETSRGPMVMMPRTNLPHNDLAAWLQPKNHPDIIWEGFKNSFDQLYAEGKAGAPKWVEITLHLHIAGRPTLVPVLKKCFDYAKSHEGVWFARRRDIAEWALKYEGKAAKS